MNDSTKPPLRWYQFGRGTLYPLIAIIGALLIGPYLDAWGVNEYTQRWLGAVFKATSSAWIGYRISRGMLRIDPSSVGQDNPNYGYLHLARAFVVGAIVCAVCLSV